jgi:MFS transporter, ACS family, hexuronate transporter
MNGRGVAQIGALTCVHALTTTALALVMASGPTLRKELVLTQTEYGLLISAFYVGQIALAIPSGSLVDRIGVRKGLTLAVFTSIASLAGLALVSGVTVAALILFVLGVSMALVNPATAKGVFDWIPDRHRAFAMSVKQTGVSVGALIAAAAAFLAVGYGRGQVFGALAAALAIGALVLLVLPENPGRPRGSAPVGLASLLRNKQLLTIGLCNGLFNVAQVGLWVSVAVFAAGLGRGPEFGAVCFGVFHAASAVGRVALGVAAVRTGPDRLWVLVLFVGCIGSAGLVALAAASSVPAVILILSVLGMTIGSYPGILQAMALKSIPRRSYASAIGVNMVLVLLGGLVAPVLVGAAVDVGGGFRAAFVLLAAVAASGSLLLFRVRKQVVG